MWQLNITFESEDYPAFADTREAWLLANLINAVKKLDYRDYTKAGFFFKNETKP